MSFDKRVLEIIACPVCKGSIEYDQPNQRLLCHADQLTFPIKDGIPILLEDQAQPLAQTIETSSDAP